MLKQIAVFLTFLVAGSVLSQSEKTGVKSFYYDGFGDDIHAFLKIELSLDKMTRLYKKTDKVKLSIFNNKGELLLDSLINENGANYPFDHGYYDLLFTKKGYDSVLIRNYYAVPDQVSQTHVLIAQGQSKIVYTTKPPAYLFPKNGTDTIYYSNGKIQQIKTYLNDKLVEEARYFEDGKLMRKMTEIENELTSLSEYYQNGKINVVAIWNTGTTSGFRKEYFEDGRLKEHLLNTDQGQLRWYSTDSSGNCIIRNGNTDLDYRKKHDLSSDTNIYKGGLKEGKWIYHRSDGSVLWVEEYLNGKKTLFEHYANDGSLISRTVY